MLTGNPHKVLEGLIIGGYAIGAQQGYIYTRHDSPSMARHIAAALEQAKELGLLGKTSSVRALTSKWNCISTSAFSSPANRAH